MFSTVISLIYQHMMEEQFIIREVIVIYLLKNALFIIVMRQDGQQEMMDFAVFAMDQVEQLIQSLIHQFHIVEQQNGTQCITNMDIFILNQ